jgi:phospholipid-translocating P-type ATPase (flippase)
VQVSATDDATSPKEPTTPRTTTATTATQQSTKEPRRYLGMSPDEVCLVEVAYQVGIIFQSRTRPAGKKGCSSEVTLANRNGEEKVFSIMYELEFNSDRKRMSVVVKFGSEVYLITKGADSVMEPLLTEGFSNDDKDYLKQYSQSGLRTLVIAYKKVDKDYLRTWEKDYKRALNLVDDTKDATISEVAARIEHELVLLGITGVEDCLQDGVPQAIATLKDCGLRVWVLTGDKTETAVDIARSCRLFEDQTTLAYATEASSLEDAQSRLQQAKKALEGVADAGLVLDGRTLQYALQSDDCRRLIYELGIASRSCVCCRLTPLQKRQLVELVREKDPSTITLAVGDGANDVPMIEGAHLGVAIRGKEGAQAVQVSDVAISQFRFLVPLLLCHGRRAYRRVAIYLCYYLYKNVVLAMGDVVWMHLDEYRGRIAFPEWVSINYNVFFTSWHILFLLGFDLDVPDAVANSHPELYLVGPRRQLFNKLIFSRWMIFALYHGVVAWVVPYYMISVDEVYDKERPTPWWEGSIASFTIIVLIVLLKLLVHTQSPLRLLTSILPTIASLVLYVMGLGIIGYMPMFTKEKPEGLQPNMKEIPGDVFANQKALIAMAAVPAVVFLGDLLFEVALKTIWPSPLDKVKASIRSGDA